MKIASRVIGLVLGFAGVAFFAVAFGILNGSFDNRRSVLAAQSTDKYQWTAAAISAAFGVLLLLAGWYFLRLDPDKAEEPGRSDRFFAVFVPYRRELKIAAEVGLVVSFIQLVVPGFHGTLMPRLAVPIVSWTALILAFVAAQMSEGRALDRLDWDQVPQRARPMLRIVWRASFYLVWIFGLYVAWSQWRHQTRSLPLLAVLPFICFFWAAMFFAYGRVRGQTRVQPHL